MHHTTGGTGCTARKRGKGEIMTECIFLLLAVGFVLTKVIELVKAIQNR